MSAERWYRLLLRAYPTSFRARYENEMLLVFRECRREQAGSALQLWAALLWDVVRSAPALRLDARQAHVGTTLHIMEAAMKTMAILAMVVGALEVVNSLVEGVAGGVHRPALQLLAVALGVIGGVVLMVAGLAMARRGARATSQALGSAVACLVAFAVIGLAAPVMSGAAMLLGIGFPLVMLAFLFVRRGRDGALPGVA